MKRTVQEYFEKKESRYGYRLILKDVQHFGYYPNINDKITEFEAQTKLHELITRKLDLKEMEQVLDIGCGRGVIACDLAKTVNINILGIDITPYIVDIAKKRTINSNLQDKVSFEIGSYENIQKDKNTFDKVYAVETLSHATNLELALNEIYRVMKPKAKAVFVEYEIAPFEDFNKDELEIYKLVRDGSAMNSLDKFQEGNFVKLLNNAGFKVIDDSDITKNRSKSMYRLYKLAVIPYQLIKTLNLKDKFVNITAGVEFYKLNEKNLFRYHLYVVQK